MMRSSCHFCGQSPCAGIQPLAPDNITLVPNEPDPPKDLPS